MKRIIPIAMAVCVVAACAPPPGTDGPSPEHGFNTVGTGLGYLVVSPLMIVAGLLEGIATLPYFIAADIHEMNRAMVAADANVDLDRTYSYAYDRRIDDVPKSGDTGKVFRYMSEATTHFQQVLVGYGVEMPEHYVLTAVRTADRDGYTLYAVINRPSRSIRVADAHTGRAVTLTPRDRAYYRPYYTDADGRPLDVMIDWAGVPRTTIKTQKGQAILMTLAANSVLINRRSDDYWSAEERWMAGDHVAVVAERKRDLDQRMGTTG